MRTYILVLLASFATAGLLLGGCSTAAPAPCQLQPSGNGGYAVRMVLDGGTGSCPAQMGDWWGFDPYDNISNRAAGPLIIAVSAQSTYPDYTGPDSGVASSPIYAKGTFDNVNPDSNNNCTVSNLSPMTTTLFDASGNPTGTFTYKVTKMTWLETAVYTGTQFEASVQYTSSTGCNGNYVARAITPPLVCTSNADCDPAPADPTKPPSGVNPAYSTACNTNPWAQQVASLITGSPPDPTTGICFFTGPYPSTGGFNLDAGQSVP
jgi:hypothetical protein